MSGIILRPQNTAYTFRLGPALSAVDAKTRVTNATINQADRRLSKAGGAYAQSAQTGALSHEANGMYPCTLHSNDFDTLGMLELDVDVANVFGMKREFLVVPQVVFDAITSNSGAGIRGNVSAIDSVVAAAQRLAQSGNSMKVVTVTNAGVSPTQTVFEFSDFSDAGTDLLKGRTLLGLSGSGMIGQACTIEGYSVVGGRGRVTVSALNAAPPNGSTFLLI